MKNCKRLLAILLCVCTVVSSMTLCASAEDDISYESYVWTFLKSVTLVFDESDPETVVGIDFEFGGRSGTDDDAVKVVFDAFDETGEIRIHDSLIWDANEMFDKVNGKHSVGSTIAVAKPVSLEEGILKTEVYSPSGEKGAKMVNIVFEGFESYAPSQLYLTLTEGLLIDSETGVKNFSDFGWFELHELQTRTVKLPNVIAGLVEDMNDDRVARFITKIVLLIPTAFISVPVLALSFEKKFKEAYSIYGIDMDDFIDDFVKTAFRFVPYLIKNSYY